MGDIGYNVERHIQIQRLVWWILGALLIITLGLSSTLFSMVKEDINRIEERQQNIEHRIEQIQTEYYRIALIEWQLKEIKKILEESR